MQCPRCSTHVLELRDAHFGRREVLSCLRSSLCRRTDPLTLARRLLLPLLIGVILNAEEDVIYLGALRQRRTMHEA